MGLISMNMESTILQIPLEDIIPNRFQPRLNFDDEALQELAQSIKEHGIIQPLVLRKLGDKYEIIAGERRYKASQIAGLTSVPAVISNIDDEKSAEVALVENLQRKNLTSIEEAKSFKNILDRGYLTQEQLAEKLGISQSTIANKLRLLNLCDEVQDALLKEKISERHARALLAVKDPTEQVKWLNKIINDRLTVRQLDIEIKKSQKTNPDEDESDIPLVELTPNIDEIKENALDIHPQEGLHDIEKMLTPSISDENTYDLSNPVEEVETLDFDEDEDENVNSDTNNNLPPNKFFNFLEDESANMSEESSIDEFAGDNYPTISNDSNLEDNSSNNEVLDEPNYNNNSYDTNISDNYIIQDNSESNFENNEPSYDNNDNSNNSFFNYNDSNTIEEDNSNNTFNDNLDDYSSNTSNDNENNDLQDSGIVEGNFFNFGGSSNDSNNNNNDDDEYIDNSNNTIEEINNSIVEEPNNSYDNLIEEVEPPKADVFDPMSMVNTLEPNYEEKVEEEQGIDLTTAIEKFREVRDQLEAAGFNITLDEADTGDSYKINIDIIK